MTTPSALMLDDAPATQGPPGAGRAPWRLGAMIALPAAALGWSYLDNLGQLAATWEKDPNYSHGYLVVPIALLILWRRRPELASGGFAPNALGWAAVLAALALRAAAYERASAWTETFTLIPAVAGLVLAAGGWGLLRAAWPSIAFLIFMLPLPQALNNLMAAPLQTAAAMMSSSLLRSTGLWVLRDGNVIVVGGEPLEVAEACNGLSMLLSLAATIVTTIFLMRMPAWKQAVLLLSIVPNALVSNVLRIAATAWCYHLYGAEIGSKYAHDIAGWLMMPTGLLLVLVELRVLSWLILEDDAEADLVVLRRA